MLYNQDQVIKCTSFVYLLKKKKKNAIKLLYRNTDLNEQEKAMPGEMFCKLSKYNYEIGSGNFGLIIKDIYWPR